MPTTTPSATIGVAVYGPNLLTLTEGETFHVHAAGCADCRRYEQHGHKTYVQQMSDLDAVVEDCYPPDQFEYDPDNAEEYATYVSDFKVFPCVKWPDSAPPLTAEERAVGDAMSKADKATAEYEDLERQVSAMSDEDFKYDPNHLRRRADFAFKAALGFTTNLTHMLNPASSNGSLSAPRRKKAAATAEPRPGAASKEGEMVCTGLPNKEESTGCGKTKPVTDFPTTGKGDRAPECRKCRNERRDAAKVAA